MVGMVVEVATVDEAYLVNFPARRLWVKADEVERVRVCHDELDCVEVVEGAPRTA
jgi:hypothetical protein